MTRSPGPNLLASLFAQDLITAEEQVEQVRGAFLQTLDRLFGSRIAGAAEAIA